ncbi:MAG TPA: phosphonopyruvate decarboxylase [Trebonia sp.]
MIEASAIMTALSRHGVTLVSGVPCSYLTPLLNQAISDPGVHYLPATQEGEAVAIAAGAWLGGGLGCAFSQNSGLGNMVNPLTSLLDPAAIPALLLVTWRGEPGRADEPQHELMGQITTPLLDLMGIPWDTLPSDTAQAQRVLAQALGRVKSERRPSAIVVRKDTVAPSALHDATPPPALAEVRRSERPAERPARAAVLERLLAQVPADAAIVSTTGYTSRELYTIDDRASNFYLVGAMGSAGPVGLGVATQTPRPVIVIDGDGALLMRLGSMATIGAYGRAGLVHVVLDNGQHESTGGQLTVSPRTDLVGVAAACGYRRAYSCATADELAEAMREALDGPGPVLLHLPIRPGALSGLGRPSVTPAEVALRFRSFAAAAPRPVVEAVR